MQELESAEYRALIGQALEEYDAHNFEEARALFLRAHALAPSARTLRGLGMAEFELRNYKDSVARLSEALASQEKRLSGTLRDSTEQLLARAGGFVAQLIVETKPAVREGARITIDGEPTGRRPGERIDVDIGERGLLLQVPGYHDEQRQLSLKGSELRRVSVELRPRPAELSQEVSAGAEQTRPLRRNPWLWTAVGAVVVGGVIAGVLLTLPRDRKDPEPVPGDIGAIIKTLGGR